LKLVGSTRSCDLVHYHYDIFELPDDPLNPLSGTKLTFLYNKKGDIDRLALPLEATVDEIVFTRIADDSMKQRAFLEPLAGEYEIGPVVITVKLQGEDTLIANVPGQPTYTLVPTQGLSFDFKDLKGFSLEFKKDEAGNVSEMLLTQPQGSAVAKRKHAAGG
jgi:hypothetical protein